VAERALGKGAKASRPGRSDKDLRPGLKYLPGLAQELVFEAARVIGHEALVVLIVDYYLRPQEIVKAELRAEGLVVPRFARPIEVLEAHRPLIAEWLGRQHRPRKPETILNILSGKLRSQLQAMLTQREVEGGPISSWRGELRCGMRELRQLARERFAAMACGDEAIYHDLCHDQDAPLEEPLYWRLGAPSRSLLAAAFDEEVALITSQFQKEAIDALQELA
jgi:hypothetical protein